MSTPVLLVACLCAGWCTTCDGYEAVFAAVARAHPQSRFVWIDVEEYSDALGDAPDLETFPTVLILDGDQLRFFGPVLPHAATLERLLEAAADPDMHSRDPVALALAQAVRALSPALPAVA